MNIFALDENPILAAQYHNDKHTSKMILESAQLMSTCYWVDKVIGRAPRALTVEEQRLIKAAWEPGTYKPSWFNHPCSIWLRSSLDNYVWLYCLALYLNEEKKYRFGTEDHKSWLVIQVLPDPIALPIVGRTEFACALGEAVVTGNSAVEKYRDYYRIAKNHLANWTRREPPDWYIR